MHLIRIGFCFACAPWVGQRETIEEANDYAVKKLDTKEYSVIYVDNQPVIKSRFGPILAIEETYGLSPIARDVYRILKTANQFVSQDQMIEILEDLCHDISTTEHDYNHCRRLWNIAQEINEKVPEIVIQKDYKLKLANREEFKAYFDKTKHDTLRKLNRLYQLAKKGELFGISKISKMEVLIKKLEETIE